MTEKLQEAENALNQIELANQTLPPELKEMLEQNKITGRFTPLEWYQHLTNLTDFQRLCDNSRQVFGKNVSRDRTFTIGCILVVAVATLFLILEVMQELGISIYFYIAGFALSFIIPFVFGQSPSIKKEKLLIKRFDAIKKPPLIPDFVGEIILPVLIILNEEMKAAHPLQLTINLSDVRFQEGQDTLKRNYVTRYNYYWKGTKYSVHEWFSFSGKLYDDASIRFNFGHRSRERHFVKHKRKGNKNKYKYSTKYNYDFRLVMPKQRYQYTAQETDSKSSKGVKSKAFGRFPRRVPSY